MPIYTSSDQLYRYVQELFERIRSSDDGSATRSVAAARLVIRLTFHSPRGIVLINGRMNPVQITYGESPTRPDLDIYLPAGVFHEILLGEISLKKALANGQLKVKGPVWKTTVLEPVFNQGKLIYPAIIQENNPR
jgi:hypothetical protein